MTTGNWSVNLTIPFAGGPSFTGQKSSKSWSGANRTAAEQYRPPQTQREAWERFEKDPEDPSAVRHEVVWVPKPGWQGQGNNSRMPKRFKETPHAYTMGYRYQADELVDFPSGAVHPVPAVWNFGTPTWAAASLLTANDDVKLVAKLGDKFRGSDFNVALLLSPDGWQGVRMITDSAIRIAKAYHHLRHADIAGATRSLLEGTSRAPLKRPPKPVYTGTVSNPLQGTRYPGASEHLKTLANNWLELQYGWLPLVEDAFAGAELLAHQLNVPLRKTYRASVFRESVTTREGQLGTFPTHRFKSLSHRWQRKTLTAVIEERPDGLPKLLGFQDPSVVAWELVPFSFVADWFIPIGTYLEARASVEGLRGTFVFSNKRVGKCFPPVSEWFNHNPTSYWLDILFDRTVSTTPIDAPMPAFKSFSEAASWRHCANALALVTQFATGSKVWSR